jgi:hypothetical protein
MVAKEARPRWFRSGVISLPTLVLGIHASLVAHVLFTVGHWPLQDRDPEVPELGGALLAHAWIANIGSYLLVVAVVALAGIAVVNCARGHTRLRRREIALFVTPFLIWSACVVLSTGISQFYGWFWD